MGRYGRRISRSLIGALIVTIVVGMVFYLKNLTTTQAEETTASVPETPAPRHLPALPKPVPTSPPVMETSTPTGPATRPEVSIAPPPSTRPASPIAQQTPAPTTPAPGLLALANTKRSAGDLLGARSLLNDALLTQTLSPAETASAKKIMADINREVVFSPKRFSGDNFGGAYSVRSGDRLARIAANNEVTWELLMRLNGITDPTKIRAGQNLKLIRGPFNAVVYKTSFTMDIYLGPPLEQGSMYVTTFNVGLGKDNSTPTGAWLVEVGKKLKNPTYFSPRGEGIIDADDPQNPLGERWIGLTGISGQAIAQASYGIHGTIDPASIGKMESMGCIRLLNEDVEWVFDLLVEGKSIVVVKE